MSQLASVQCLETWAKLDRRILHLLLMHLHGAILYCLLSNITWTFATCDLLELPAALASRCVSPCSSLHNHNWLIKCSCVQLSIEKADAWGANALHEQVHRQAHSTKLRSAVPCLAYFGLFTCHSSVSAAMYFLWYSFTCCSPSELLMSPSYLHGRYTAISSWWHVQHFQLQLETSVAAQQRPTD